MDVLQQLWSSIASALAQQTVAPFLAFLHLTHLMDSPNEIAGFLMVSAAQVSIIALVFRPLERQTAQATRVDRSYTLLKLLGLVPLFTYLILVPVSNLLGGGGDGEGLLQLDRFFPWLKQQPVVLFLLYFAIYDFTLYVVRRLHHMRDDPAYPDRHNCNFSLVFPIWDILFGTALYNEPPHPCGVSDKLIDADNDIGLWAQQGAALKRFWSMLAQGAMPTYPDRQGY